MLRNLKLYMEVFIYIFTGAPVHVYVSHFHILSLNMDLFNVLIIQNGGYKSKHPSLDTYRKNISLMKISNNIT